MHKLSFVDRLVVSSYVDDFALNYSHFIISASIFFSVRLETVLFVNITHAYLTAISRGQAQNSRIAQDVKHQFFRRAFCHLGGSTRNRRQQRACLAPAVRFFGDAAAAPYAQSVGGNLLAGIGGSARPAHVE